jgi:hypothetical protein
MSVLMDALAILSVAVLVGVLAVVWRGRSFWSWAVPAGLVAFVSAPWSAFACIVMLAFIDRLDDDDSGDSLPSVSGFGGGDD